MLFLIFPFLQTLDYITIVLLLAGIFVAGSLFFGSGHNLRSFFAGGGNITDFGYSCRIKHKRALKLAVVNALNSL